MTASRITFRLARHTARQVEVVEVLCDGEMCGVIYPLQGKALMLVSAHMTDVTLDDGAGEPLQIPAVRVTFDPRPYRIDAQGRMLRK